MSEYGIYSLTSWLRDRFEYTPAHLEQLRAMVERSSGLTKREIMEAITWMILGDGSIERKERGNYAFSVSHRPESEDYLIWKGSIIQHFTSFDIKPQPITSRVGSEQFNRLPGDTHEMLRLRTSAHPWFTRVWEHVYGVLGRKCIPPHALALLGPLGLAILYQDDGSLSLPGRYDSEANLLIHTLGYSQFEVEALAKTIVDKFGIIFRVNRNKDKGFGFRLRCRQKDVPKFLTLVEPYIVPSMQYKLGAGSIS